MTVGSSAAAKQAKASADLTSIGNNASLSIYGGTRPATPDTAAGSTALWTTSMGSGVAFGTASSGVITAGTIPSASITTTGTAVWARLATSGAAGVFDFDVSTTAAGTGDIQLSTTTLTTGVTLTINSFTLTEQ
jgi:hypothetical protein